MPIAVPFTGGCACGAIRYECSAKPIAAANCHCRDCQRATGSAFASLSFVAAAAFTLRHGEPTYYAVQADNGHTTRRGFCSTCGSPVCGKIDELSDIIMLPAASLDDPSGHQPRGDLFTSRAQPWAYMHPDLPKFAEEPTEEEAHALRIP